MSHSEDAGKRISILLEKLQVQPDAVSVTLQGRATGRNETSLHLAVANGIVAIPLEEIEDVTPLSPTSDPTLVSVQVKNHTKVRHLLKVETTVGSAETSGGHCTDVKAAPLDRLRGGIGGIGGFGGGRGVFGNEYCDTYTARYQDTATTSGGILDQTDDTHLYYSCDGVFV